MHQKNNDKKKEKKKKRKKNNNPSISTIKIQVHKLSTIAILSLRVSTKLGGQQGFLIIENKTIKCLHTIYYRFTVACWYKRQKYSSSQHRYAS